MANDEFVWAQNEVAGTYANCFRVAFNAFELLIDFAQCNSTSRLAVQHTRIIVSPAYAKVLHGLLAAAIKQYDFAHGRKVD